MRKVLLAEHGDIPRNVLDKLFIVSNNLEKMATWRRCITCKLGLLDSVAELAKDLRGHQIENMQLWGGQMSALY